MRFVVLLLATGCAAATAPIEAPATPPPADEGQTPSGREAPGTSGTAPSEESTAPPVSAEGPSASTPRLPALELSSIGMHVGGGANDPKSKAPFLAAVERQFPAFLECFRLATPPGRGGTFGIDLRIASTGGAPEVEQPRTAIPGDAFRDCMLRAFSEVSFEPPGKALVISYSLRFSLGAK
jgi:hypothetical protein